MNAVVRIIRSKGTLYLLSWRKIGLAGLSVFGLKACGGADHATLMETVDKFGVAPQIRSIERLNASSLRRVCHLDRPYVPDSSGYVSLENGDLVYFGNIPGDSSTYRVRHLDHSAEGKFPATVKGRSTLCDFNWHRRVVKSDLRAVLMPELPHTGSGLVIGPRDFVDVASLSADRLEPVRNAHLTLIRGSGDNAKRGWLADAGVVLAEPSLGRVVKDLPSQLYSGITLTSYYPSSDPLQGGFTDRFGVPLKGRTINDFMEKVRKEGFSSKPFVVVAMDHKIGRDNHYLRIPDMEKLFGAGCIAFKVRDTGGAFIGRGYAKIDVLSRDYATAYNVIGKRSGKAAIFYNKAYPCR